MKKKETTNTTNMDATVTGTSASSSYSQYCSFRLPCGICTRTNSMCPLGNSNIITYPGIGDVPNPWWPWWPTVTFTSKDIPCESHSTPNPNITAQNTVQ